MYPGNKRNKCLPTYLSRFQISSYQRYLQLIHNFFSDRFDADISSSICATPDSESLTIVKESSATNFFVKWFLAGSQMNFSYQKNCQMKTGQYTIQLTNPVIRYYNPMPGNLPPFVSGENIFANMIEFWSDNRVP